MLAPDTSMSPTPRRSSATISARRNSCFTFADRSSALPKNRTPSSRSTARCGPVSRRSATSFTGRMRLDRMSWPSSTRSIIGRLMLMMKIMPASTTPVTTPATTE